VNKRFSYIKEHPRKVIDHLTGQIYEVRFWPVEDRVKHARDLCGCHACSAVGKFRAETCNMAAAIFEQLPECQRTVGEDGRQERLPHT
jgi:hypothetical protein